MRGAHSRAARALLGWSQRELAERAKVGLRLLVEFEKEARELTPSGMVALEKALVDAGIAFVETDEAVGVRIDPSALGGYPG